MHMHLLDALSMHVVKVASRGVDVKCVAGTGIALQGGVVQHKCSTGQCSGVLIALLYSLHGGVLCHAPRCNTQLAMRLVM
jgi:hypothetical protein